MKKLLAFLYIVLISTISLKSQPVISYIIPDIGTPDMNTYFEIIGPFNSFGNFGNDIFSLNNQNSDVRVEVFSPSDSSKLIFGPIVVSWQGRMIAGQAFVNPNVKPNSSDWQSLQNQFRIPFRVFVNGKGYSNVDTFFLVQPQQLGNISTINETILGQGLLGKRSKRGAMILDSLELSNKTYTISTSDCDPSLDASRGNQGYLPVIILSKGPIKGQIATKIDVSANKQHAGPGGGGGGGKFYDAGLLDNGIGDNGGNGYIGGGPGGRNNSGIPGTPNAFKSTGIGSYESGKSLNGNPAPVSGQYESSGGATAHPFGSSGKPCDDGNNCIPTGGYGGGSGNRQTTAGGSAGNAIDGEGPFSSKGLSVGNSMLVPLAGGSGGASGNPQGVYTSSGNGGGGGGAISIFAEKISFISFGANGANGENELADGGNGAGGSVQIFTKNSINYSDVEVNGGVLGNYSASYGRVRLDIANGIPNIQNPEVNYFTGFTTDTTKTVYQKFTLNGTKPSNKSLKLFIKPEGGDWQEISTINSSGFNWSTSIDLPTIDTLFYLTAMMYISNPVQNGYITEPIAIFSQSAANVLKLAKKSEILVSVDKIDYGLRSKCADVDTTFYIYNSPSASANLTILKRANIIGPDKDNFEISLEPGKIPISIAPGDSLEYSVRYTADGGAEGFKYATIQIETDSPTEPIIEIDLQAEREDLHIDVNPSMNVDYGNVFAGFSHDTIVTLTNTGRLNQTVFDIITSDPDLTVFPYGGLLAANSANSMDFTFTLNQTKPGTNNYWAKFIFEYQCDDTLTIFFSGTTAYSNYTIPDSLNFGLLSPCDTKLDSMFLENRSNAPYIVQSISTIFGIDASLFTKQNPGLNLPDTLYPNEKKAIYVTFTPGYSTDGNKSAFINLDLKVNGENVTKTIYFAGKLATGFAKIPDSLDFGRVIVFTTKKMDLVLENIGPWEIVVSNFTPAQNFPAIFTYTNPGVIKIYPTEKLIIPINFSPDQIMDYVDSLTFSFQIGNCPAINKKLILSAKGVPAVNFTISIPDLIVEPNIENLKIPIYGIVELPTDSISGFNLDTLEISFDRSLFFPLSIENSNGKILSNNISGNIRTLILSFNNIKLTDKDTLIGHIIGHTLLGNTDSTSIVIGKISHKQFNLVSLINQDDGSLSINICRNGGDRLIDVQALPLSGVINPNPSNGEVTLNLNLLEIGLYKLTLIDITGKEFSLDNFEHLQGSSGQISLKYNFSQYGTGLYRLVINSPTELYSLPILIIK